MRVWISKKRNEYRYTLLDDEDYEWAKRWVWRFRGESVSKSTHNKIISLPRTIMSPPNGFEVDHIDRNRLNNQRSNLRICTRAQNEMNKPVRPNTKSGYKGVNKGASKKRPWRANIYFCGKHYHLGGHETKEEAALAYNKKAKELYGEFAWLNPID